MIQFYVMMVQTNKVVINDVPALWREHVKKEMEKKKSTRKKTQS